MQSETLVSAIIPCYNQGQYLDESVSSLLGQSHQNIEILIIDDGSTDEFTIQKLKSIKHPKIKVIHKDNGHLSSARNFGFQHARSEFVLTLDADDRYHPSFIERTLPIIEQSKNTAVVSSWAKHFGKKQNIKILSGGGIENFLLNNSCTACALIRKSIWFEVGGYDENLRGFMDWEFYINITKRGYNIHVIQEPLFYYRASNTSMISGSLKRKPELFQYIYKKHEDVYSRHTAEILYEKEVEIAQTREKFQKSSAYRLGSFLLWPFITLKRYLIFRK